MRRIQPSLSIVFSIILAVVLATPGAQAQDNSTATVDTTETKEMLARMERLEAKIDLLARLLQTRLQSEGPTMQPAVFTEMQGQGNQMRPLVPPGMESGLVVEVQFCNSRGPSFSIGTDAEIKARLAGNVNLGNGVKGGAGVIPAPEPVGPNGHVEGALEAEWHIINAGLGMAWNPRDLSVCITLPSRPLREDIDTMDVKDKFERRIDRMTRRLLKRILGKTPDDAFAQPAIAQLDEPTPLDDLFMVDDLVDTLDLRTTPQGLVNKLKDPGMMFEGFQETVAGLPLPGKLGEVAQNPAGQLASFLPQSFDDLRPCNLNLGAGLIGEICNLAQSADFSFLTIGQTMNNLRNELSMYCNGVNSRLGTIRDRALGSFIHFPVLEQTVLTQGLGNPFRPFSGLANVNCPNF